MWRQNLNTSDTVQRLVEWIVGHETHHSKTRWTGEVLEFSVSSHVQMFCESPLQKFFTSHALLKSRYIERDKQKRKLKSCWDLCASITAGNESRDGEEGSSAVDDFWRALWKASCLLFLLLTTWANTNTSKLPSLRNGLVRFFSKVHGIRDYVKSFRMMTLWNWMMTSVKAPGIAIVLLSIISYVSGNNTFCYGQISNVLLFDL